MPFYSETGGPKASQTLDFHQRLASSSSLNMLQLGLAIHNWSARCTGTCCSACARAPLSQRTSLTRAQPLQAVSSATAQEHLQASLAEVEERSHWSCDAHGGNLGRRQLLQAGCAVLAVSSLTGPAAAGPADGLLRSFVRPDIAAEQAVTMLLDAKGTLAELKRLADSPPNSDLRFHSRVLLPGMAKRLREVGQAAPVVAALATGTDRESNVAKQYGGSATGPNAADPVYSAIGQVVTLSGRTIRKTAQVDSQLSEDAIQRIDELLAQAPRTLVDKAKQARASRAARA